MVRAIGSSPEEPFSQIYATLLSAIGSAETSVYLTNAYFAPDPQLLTALEDAAAQRGVDVTPDSAQARPIRGWCSTPGARYYERLLRAGCEASIERQRRDLCIPRPRLIDGVWATVGSTNLDWRSFLHNHELNAVVLGPEFGQQVQAMFNRDLAASDGLSLATWQARPLHARVSEWFAQAWAYWL